MKTGGVAHVLFQEVARKDGHDSWKQCFEKTNDDHDIFYNKDDIWDTAMVISKDTKQNADKISVVTERHWMKAAYRVGKERYDIIERPLANDLDGVQHLDGRGRHVHHVKKEMGEYPKHTIIIGGDMNCESPDQDISGAPLPSPSWRPRRATPSWSGARRFGAGPFFGLRTTLMSSPTPLNRCRPNAAPRSRLQLSTGCRFAAAPAAAQRRRSAQSHLDGRQVLRDQAPS